MGQFREVRRAEHHILFGVQQHIPAIVVFHQARPHVLAAHRLAGIHMRQKAQHGHIPGSVARQGAGHIAPAIHLHIFQAHGLHFFHQQAAQVLLFLSAGISCGI